MLYWGKFYCIPFQPGGTGKLEYVPPKVLRLTRKISIQFVIPTRQAAECDLIMDLLDELL